MGILPFETYVGTSAFENDESLSSIQGFPGNVSYIGRDAFNGCKNLRMHVNHPGALSDQYVDSGITGITFKASGTYNEALTSLSCWDEDDSLSFSNRIAQGSAGFSPFEGDTSCLSAYSFKGCTNLSTFEVIGGSADSVWVGSDGALYARQFNSDWSNFPDSATAGVTNVLVKYPAGKSGGAYSVPADAKAIAPLAFADCKFSGITLPVTLEWLLVEFENYDDEGDGDHRSGPFSYMASEPTVHYVAGSWVDDQVNGGSISRDNTYWYAGIYRGPKATMAGPTVQIVYSMDGGINNPNNPTSVKGGSSVELLAPTRENRVFSCWYRKLGEDDFEQIPDDMLTPRRGELVSGVVTVEPGWGWLNVKDATIKLSRTSYVFDAKAKTPGVTVVMGDKTLVKDADYTVTYANNKIVGTATVTVTGIGDYRGSASKTFTIVKAANPYAAKAAKTSLAVKLAKVKKAKVTLATNNIKVVKKAPSRVAYANAKTVAKTKKWAVNKNTGKVTVPKGTKKGTYTVAVKVTAAGNANYKAKTVTIKYKVVVK